MPETSSAALAADVVLTRTFHAPRALVWRVWTDPNHLAKWWGPHRFSNPRVEMDLRPGGALRVDMQGPDGVNAMTGEIREGWRRSDWSSPACSKPTATPTWRS